MLQVTEGPIKPLKKQGLKDGGHIILRCSNCNKPLVDIWIIKPDAPIETNAIAKCCFCGDQSETVTFKGRYAAGGYGENNPEDPEDSKMKTALLGGPQPVGDKTIFNTQVVKS